MNINQEQKAENHLNIIISLDPVDYVKQVDDGLKQLAKKVSLHGFRPGKAPVGLVKKNYGGEVLADELNKIVNDTLQNYIKEKQWNIFAQPVPFMVRQQNFDINKPEVLDFGFEIGLLPELKVADLNNVAFTLNEVEITDAMVDEEVEKLQMRHGTMVTPEIVTDQDILVAEWAELDENGELKTGGVTSSTSVAINKIADKEIMNQIIKMQIGDQLKVDINSLFANDHELIVHHVLNVDHHTADHMGSNFMMTVKNFNHIDKAEITQDLFDKSFGKDQIKTVEELRSRLKTELKNAYDRAAQSRLSIAIRDWLLEKTNLQLPEAYLKNYLVYINEGKITEDQVDQEMPYFVLQLKWDLISGNLSKENNIEVNSNELKQFVKQEFANEYFAGQLNGMEDSLDKIADMVMGDEKNLKTYRDRLTNDKLFTALKSKIKVETKTVSQHEFMHH